jgi:predicted TIM-barrel fold metal-dependent hydrolase
MYKGIKVLDVHGHVSAPGNGFAVLAGMLASNTPRVHDPRTPQGLAGLNMTPEAWNASTGRHVGLMDDHNIDVQIIGPRPFAMLGWMQPHLLPHWTRLVNNFIFKQVEMHPTRFIGAAQLPQRSDAEDLSHCLPELERCVNELGFGAVYLSPDPAGARTTPGMHKPYWYPVYERCQKLGLPIIVHGTNCVDQRFDVIPENYQIGFVMEQYLATQLLSHSDVFERFPELKVVVCHCGGALDRFIPSDRHLSQKDLRNNLFFDTCALDVNYLTAAIKQRTPARMLFGTETPGSGGAIRPETGRPSDDLVPIISGFDFLSEDDKQAIFHKNVLRICPALKKLAA